MLGEGAWRAFPCCLNNLAAVVKAAGGYRFATSPLARDVVEAYLLPPKTWLSAPALEALPRMTSAAPEATAGSNELLAVVRAAGAPAICETPDEDGGLAADVSWLKEHLPA